MEFIVKIGADQQNLQDTVKRMTDEFKRMNVSIPMSWGPPPGRGAVLNSGQRNFLAEQAAAQSQSFGDRAIGAATNRGIQLLKANVWIALTQLVSDVLGSKLWEHIYGTDEATMAKVLAAHTKISGVVKNLHQRRDDLAREYKEAVLAAQDAPGRVTILTRDKATAGQALAAREKEFSEAKQNYDDAMSGRTTKGVDGEKLMPWERRRFTLALAEAETKLLEARIEELRVSERLRIEHGAMVDANTRRKPASGSRGNGEQMPGGSPLTFAVGSLEQAGLFAGSSLLFNPNFTIEQRQLACLEMISQNTSRITPGAFG